jgi:predicted Zn finger-like uncharacterized protein
LRVSCERCATDYDFDPTLIAKGGTRVRCTSCGHVFRVVAPEAEAASWVVRTQDGELYEVGSIGELKARIASRELSPDDEIRRGDEAWKSLGEIAELTPHFEAARGGFTSGVSISEPPKLAPQGSSKSTLIGVGLSGDTPRRSPIPPPLEPRRTLPDLVAPPLGPAAPPREPGSIDGERPRGSATTLLPEQEPVRGSATTLLPGQGPAPHPPQPTPAMAINPPPPSSSVAWHEAPSPDEPFIYRPSEPLIPREHLPLRLDSERPRRRAPQPRRGGPRLGVILPLLVGLGFGIGFGLRHRLPEPLRSTFASLHNSLFDDHGGAPPRDAPPTPAEDVDSNAAVDPTPPAEARAVELAEQAPAEQAPAEQAPAEQAPAEVVQGASAAEEPTSVEEESISFDALLRRGERALERGRMSAARRDFERALEMRPGSPEALTGLGYVALDAGSAGAAAERFRAAAKASYADAYIGLGEAYRKLGRAQDALAAYERYLERWPGGSSASVARAQASAIRASLSRAPAAAPTSDDEDDDE